jgi:hypothetical protein
LACCWPFSALWRVALASTRAIRASMPTPAKSRLSASTAWRPLSRWTRRPRNPRRSAFSPARARSAQRGRRISRTAGPTSASSSTTPASRPRFSVRSSGRKTAPSTWSGTGLRRPNERGGRLHSLPPFSFIAGFPEKSGSTFCLSQTGFR